MHTVTLTWESSASRGAQHVQDLLLRLDQQCTCDLRRQLLRVLLLQQRKQVPSCNHMSFACQPYVSVCNVTSPPASHISAGCSMCSFSGSTA